MVNRWSEQAVQQAFASQPWPLWSQIAIGVAVGMVAWTLVCLVATFAVAARVSPGGKR